MGRSRGKVVYLIYKARRAQIDKVSHCVCGSELIEEQKGAGAGADGGWYGRGIVVGFVMARPQWGTGAVVGSWRVTHQSRGSRLGSDRRPRRQHAGGY